MGLPVEVAREGCVGSHGAGITSSCQLSNMDSGNQIWILWKNSKVSVIELPSIEPLPLPSPPLNAGLLVLDSCFFVSSIVSMLTGRLNGFKFVIFFSFYYVINCFIPDSHFPEILLSVAFNICHFVFSHEWRVGLYIFIPRISTSVWEGDMKSGVQSYPQHKVGQLGLPKAKQKLRPLIGQ